jgi:ubiquinone/menaquinone biosynthesis C-methylase UbiE
MACSVCPWWLGYFLASPIRKLRQNPTQILAPYVKEGMTALDVGSAMGFFSLPMAKLVGEKGKVVAVDLQERMINSLIRRARKAGLSSIIDAYVCSANSLGLEEFAGQIDFALAFAVLHEFPAIPPALLEISHALKPGGILLIAEPTGHVTKPGFSQTILDAQNCGLEIIESPNISHSHSVVLKKTAQ